MQMDQLLDNVSVFSMENSRMLMLTKDGIGYKLRKYVV